MERVLLRNVDVFSLSASSIDPNFICHKLAIFIEEKPI